MRSWKAGASTSSPRRASPTRSSTYFAMRACWNSRPGRTSWSAGAAIRSDRVEYDYTKKVGYELGLRGLGVCTGCGPGAMKGPMKGATVGHSKQRIVTRALSRHHRARHHRRGAAQSDREPARDHAGHRETPRGLRSSRPRHRRVSGRCGDRGGNPLSARGAARSANRDLPFPVVFSGPRTRAPEYFTADPPVHRSDPRTRPHRRALRRSSTIRRPWRAR